MIIIIIIILWLFWTKAGGGQGLWFNKSRAVVGTRPPQEYQRPRRVGLMILVSDKCAKSHFQVSRQRGLSVVRDSWTAESTVSSQSWSTVKVVQGRMSNPRLLHYNDNDKNYYYHYYYHYYPYLLHLQGWMVLLTSSAPTVWTERNLPRVRVVFFWLLQFPSAFTKTYILSLCVSVWFACL